MKRMKTGLLSAMLLFALALSGWEADMLGKKLVRHNKTGSILDENRKTVLNFSTVPADDFGLVKTTLENGEWTLDTREFFKKNNTGYVLVFWQGLRTADFVLPEPGKSFSEKVNTAEIVATTGTPALQFFGRTAKSDFYAKNQRTETPAEGGLMRIVNVNSALASDTKQCSLRQVFARGGVYRIRSAKFYVQEPEKIKAREQNLLVNGHAEQKLMYNPRTRFEYQQYAHNGKHLDWFGKEFVEGKNKKVLLDSSEKHSGKYSFRIEWDAASNTYAPYIQFAPVPVKPQAPVCMSAWIKAEKPAVATLRLFTSGGTAVVKTIQVDTQWKRYEMYLPQWGEKTPGVSVSDRILTEQGTEFNLACPAVGLNSAGKIWVDDVVYFFGGRTKDQPLEKVYLSGKLDHDVSYYFTGEPVLLNLHFNHLSDKELSGELSYEIRDFEGKTLLRKDAGKISLKANEDLDKELTVTLPEHLRGAFNIVVEFKAEGKTYPANFYAGVLEKNTNLSPRIGLELAPHQNTKYAIPYYKDFRIGFTRICWQPDPMHKEQFQVASEFGAAGIKVILASGAQIVKNPETYLPILKENVRKYKGLIEIYESTNESNLIPYITPEKDVEGMRLLRETVKSIDPAAKIAGPASCHTDLPWTESVLAKGGAKYLDIITEHPYRNSPEYPDLALEMQNWRKVIDRYKPGMPHYSSEAGRCQESVLPGNMIDDFTRQQTSLDIRNIIQAFAGGVERYVQFIFSAWQPGITYNVMFRGNGANNGTPVPGLTMYAMRALTDRLEDAKIERRVKFGSDYRCYIFDHGKKRTATFWKCDGAPAKITFSEDDAEKLAVYDFMGTRIPSNEFSVNQSPKYIDSTLSAAEFEQLLLKANISDSSQKKLDVACDPVSETAFGVKVRNLTGKPIDCTVTIETAGLVKGKNSVRITGIPGETEKIIPFELNSAKIDNVEKNVRISVQTPGSEKITAEAKLSALFVSRAPARLTIDGDLSDWPENAKAIRLDGKNVRWKAKSWGAKEDAVCADVRFAWDYDFLYFSAVVRKPDFFGAKDAKNLSKLFHFDSFQLGFDTMKNALPGEKSLGNDDFEYDLGEHDGKPLVYRRKSSAAVYDSLTKEVGAAKEVLFALKQYPDRTVYEAAFPRRAVSPFKLQPGSAMKTGVLLNLNNGKERVGYLELTDGLSDKYPAKWIDFILLP
ncbi:MAG: hypothetical protein SPK75_03730 [Victivallales bacterium]|nr:hypothetical protein [Victivallales bacterium]